METLGIIIVAISVGYMTEPAWGWLTLGLYLILIGSLKALVSIILESNK